MRLAINEEKTKYRLGNPIGGYQRDSQVDIGQYSFEDIKEFTYLGTQMNPGNYIYLDIHLWVMSDNRWYDASSDAP